MRLTPLWPSLLLALALIAMLSGSMNNINIVICLVDTLRMVRGSALAVREMDFATAAETIGARDQRIMVLHILPNILAPIIIQATFITAFLRSAAEAMPLVGRNEALARIA